MSDTIYKSSGLFISYKSEHLSRKTPNTVKYSRYCSLFITLKKCNVSSPNWLPIWRRVIGSVFCMRLCLKSLWDIQFYNFGRAAVDVGVFLHCLVYKDESPGQSNFSASLVPHWGNFVSLAAALLGIIKRRLIAGIQVFSISPLLSENREDKRLIKLTLRQQLPGSMASNEAMLLSCSVFCLFPINGIISSN